MARVKRSTSNAPFQVRPPVKKDVLEQLISDIHNYHINYHTRELYLHGSYNGSVTADDEPGVEYRMATTFIKNLHILSQQSARNILIHMHTIGGNWCDGMAVFQAIRLSKSPMTILGYAQASSMSGIILQAADNRVLMPDCEVMIHHGSISLDSNSMAVKSAVDLNEKYCKRMLTVFASRAIKGEFFRKKRYGLEKVMAFIDDKIKQHSDWYLSPEEAVFYGIADGIYGERGFESFAKIRIGRKMKE